MIQNERTIGKLQDKEQTKGDNLETNTSSHCLTGNGVETDISREPSGKTTCTSQACKEL